MFMIKNIVAIREGCVLEKLEPKQTSKIQDILKILSELCEVI